MARSLLLEGFRNLPVKKKCWIKIFLQVVGADLVKNDAVKEFIVEHAREMLPDRIHICNGSQEENDKSLRQMERTGMIKRLTKYPNWLDHYSTIVLQFEKLPPAPTLQPIRGATSHFN